MDMKKLIVIIFALITIDAVSQNKKQTIDPTVEVNRDFEGKMMEITKGKLGTAIADSLYRFNMDFNYTIFNKPYRDLYEFSPVESANLPQLESKSFPSLVARLGIGYPLAPVAEIIYTPELEGNHFLKLAGNFGMYKGDVPLYTIDAGKIANSGNNTENKENDYGVGAAYTYAWRSGEFTATAGYKGGKRSYFQSGDSQLWHRFNQIEGGMGVKSSGAGKYGQKFNYILKGDFRYTEDNPLKENLVSISGELGPTVGRYNRFMIGIGGKYLKYSGTANYHYGLFGVTPQYRFANGNLSVNLGVKIEGKFTDDTLGRDNFHNTIFPAANVSLGIVPQKLWLFAKVDGWNNLNAWSDVFALNKWITPEETFAASSVPVHAQAGFQGRFTDKFSYRLYAGYSMHKGLLQFAYNLDKGHFTAFNSNHDEFKAGAVLDVATEPFQGGVSLKYTSFTQGKKSTFIDGIDAVGVPQLQGEIYGKYNWNNKLSIGASCHLQGKSKALCTNGNLVDADGFADLGATVEYAVTPAFTAWVRGENILGAETLYTPFYQRKMRGILAGIIIKL